MRTFGIALVSVSLALVASGCLRNKFDLCSADPPDPECEALDAGRDGGVDAAEAGADDAGIDGGTDAASTDAASSDASSVDAAGSDAASTDAASTDAASTDAAASGG